MNIFLSAVINIVTNVDECEEKTKYYRWVVRSVEECKKKQCIVDGLMGCYEHKEKSQI